MAFTSSIPITNWTVAGNTATSVTFQQNITIRGNSSNVRITVNVPLSNWGTTASNHHMTVLRSAVGAFTINTTSTGDLMGGNYGIHHILSGVQYDSAHFSFIDTLPFTKGSTYYYCLAVRSNSAATTASNIGNSNNCDMVLEELY